MNFSITVFTDSTICDSERCKRLEILPKIHKDLFRSITTQTTNGTLRSCEKEDANACTLPPDDLPST